MNLKFTDGMEIETSGKLRPIKKRDGWYVVGKGFCIPVEDYHEALETILELEKPK